MSEEEEGTFPEPLLWALLGTLLTAVIGGISFCVQKRCRNTSCDISSGCCKFHSDSHLRATIREEIEKDKQNQDLESQPTAPSEEKVVNLSDT